jgi:hypothetical protein
MSSLRISERTVRSKDCPACGAAFEHVTGFVDDDRGAHAVYFAACHRHPEPEAQIDVVLGTWGSGDASDHVTFSCRLRASGAMLADATVATDTDDRILGHKLDRDEALAHAWLEGFWNVVDLLASDDPTVGQHVGAAHPPG